MVAYSLTLIRSFSLATPAITSFAGGLVAFLFSYYVYPINIANCVLSGVIIQGYSFIYYLLFIIIYYLLLLFIIIYYFLLFIIYYFYYYYYSSYFYLYLLLLIIYNYYLLLLFIIIQGYFY